MNRLEFKFDEAQFNHLFPFYLLINNSLQIEDFGKGLKKICPDLKKGTEFSDYFRINRPLLENPTYQNIIDNSNQLVVVENQKNKISLRGQFEQLDSSILFVGSPWFNSMNQVIEKGLTLHDFALHDPLLDLLHVLNNAENTSAELKELLSTINDQKNKLKIANKEIHDLALFPTQNPDPIFRIDFDGNLLKRNPSAELLSSFNHKGKEYNPNDFFKFILTQIDHKQKRWVFEIKSKARHFSFVCISLHKEAHINIYGRDITEEKKQEQQLLLLSLIAENNINAVVISDADGKIEWVNSSFINISGYTMDEAIGKTRESLLHGEETHQETITSIKNRITDGSSFKCELLKYTKDGQKYWVNIQGQALYNKNGDIIKFFTIEENITKKKELEQQREFLMKHLEKSNKELEDYAAIVSHDLKSPLRSIHSLISWIKEDNDKELNDQTTQYLSMIEGKVEKMDHLIEGILTIAKIDKTNIVSKKVNTHVVIQNIIDIIHIPEHISISIIDTLPIIYADQFRIQQLFQNLIDNAVNYIDKPKGLIEISCFEKTRSYTFSVKDNGPGIAKRNQEKIFEIFQSLAKSDKSTGLGLSIVKKIVDMYNGKVWIESELGGGTTFFIQLPKP